MKSIVADFSVPEAMMALGRASGVESRPVAVWRRSGTCCWPYCLLCGSMTAPGDWTIRRSGLSFSWRLLFPCVSVAEVFNKLKQCFMKDVLKGPQYQNDGERFYKSPKPVEADSTHGLGDGINLFKLLMTCDKSIITVGYKTKRSE